MYSPKTTKKPYLIHKHDISAIRNNSKFDILVRMPRKFKRTLGIGMQMKTRTPHQNQIKIRKLLSLPEFLFFPWSNVFFKKERREKESFLKIKKKKKNL